jgi:cytoskeletal protein RodZ
MTYVDPQVPPTERVIEVRRESSASGWVVAGIVAVVAVIAVTFMIVQRPNDLTQDQVTQAQEQGRAAGVIEGAQSTVATSAQQAQLAAESAARQAADAADAARRDTERAAASASQEAKDAADRVAASGDSRAPSPDSQPAPQPQ